VPAILAGLARRVFFGFIRGRFGDRRWSRGRRGRGGRAVAMGMPVFGVVVAAGAVAVAAVVVAVLFVGVRRFVVARLIFVVRAAMPVPTIALAAVVAVGVAIAVAAADARGHRRRRGGRRFGSSGFAWGRSGCHDGGRGRRRARRGRARWRRRRRRAVARPRARLAPVCGGWSRAEPVRRRDAGARDPARRRGAGCASPRGHRAGADRGAASRSRRSLQRGGVADRLPSPGRALDRTEGQDRPALAGDQRDEREAERGRRPEHQEGRGAHTIEEAVAAEAVGDGKPAEAMSVSLEHLISHRRDTRKQ